MNTRPEITISESNEIKNEMKQNPFVKAFVQTSLSSFSIASTLFIPEMWQTSQQVNKGQPLTLRAFFTNFLLADYKLLKRNFMTAQKASLVKNASIANQGPIRAQVEGVMHDVQPENQHVGEIISVEKDSFKKKFAPLFLAGTMITFFDTSITNYYANLRIYNTLHVYPNFLTIKEMAKFSLMGFPMRFSRNFSGTFLYIVSNSVAKEEVDKFFSQTSYGSSMSGAIATIGSAMTAAIFNNWLEVIWKNQIIQANLSTYKTPSGLAIAKQLYQEAGLKKFVSGTKSGIFLYTMGFGILNGVDYVVNNVLFKETQSMASEKEIKTLLADSSLATHASLVKDKNNIKNTQQAPLPSTPCVLSEVNHSALLQDTKRWKETKHSVFFAPVAVSSNTAQKKRGLGVILEEPLTPNQYVITRSH